MRWSVGACEARRTRLCRRDDGLAHAEGNSDLDRRRAPRVITHRVQVGAGRASRGKRHDGRAKAPSQALTSSPASVSGTLPGRHGIDLGEARDLECVVGLAEGVTKCWGQNVNGSLARRRSIAPSLRRYPPFEARAQSLEARSPGSARPSTARCGARRGTGRRRRCLSRRFLASITSSTSRRAETPLASSPINGSPLLGQQHRGRSR